MPEPVSLSDLQEWCRIDVDGEGESPDDELLESLGIAAREFVETATGRDYSDAAPERAKLAIKALVAHWYEHRGDTDAPQPAHVRRLINQLKSWCEPEEAEA